VRRYDLAVVVSTHDRVEYARVNMEIIRATWPELLGRVLLVHAYNGPGKCEPYLEDLTVQIPRGPSHYTGAAELIDAGSAAISSQYPEVQYVVYLASDTWLYRPAALRHIVDDMRARALKIATTPFGVADDAHGVSRERGDPHLLPGTGFTTDFFVIDLPWAVKFGMLPLDLSGFVDQYGDLLAYFQEIVLLEKHVEGRYLSAVRSFLQQTSWPKDGLGSEGLRQARALLRPIDERPIDPAGRSAPPHKSHWPELGLTSTEDADLKRAELARVAGLRGGPTLTRFLGDNG
jgi:hypothetical protein